MDEFSILVHCGMEVGDSIPDSLTAFAKVGQSQVSGAALEAVAEATTSATHLALQLAEFGIQEHSGGTVGFVCHLVFVVSDDIVDVVEELLSEEPVGTRWVHHLQPLLGIASDVALLAGVGVVGPLVGGAGSGGAWNLLGLARASHGVVELVDVETGEGSVLPVG